MANRFESWGDAFTEGGDGCWETAPTAHGYGYIRWNGRRWGAHQLSFYLWNGREAEGVVRHDCDNPACYRPDHLRDGSQADNLKDMTARGRRYSKVTEDDVRTMRARHAEGGVTYAQLGREYGMTKTGARNAIIGKTWSHVA